MDTVTPTSVGGGTIGAPAIVASPKPTDSRLNPSGVFDNPTSGVEARGVVQWGLLSLSIGTTGLICGHFI